FIYSLLSLKRYSKSVKGCFERLYFFFCSLEYVFVNGNMVICPCLTSARIGLILRKNAFGVSGDCMLFRRESNWVLNVCSFTYESASGCSLNKFFLHN